MQAFLSQLCSYAHNLGEKSFLMDIFIKDEDGIIFKPLFKPDHDKVLQLQSLSPPFCPRPLASAS